MFVGVLDDAGEAEPPALAADVGAAPAEVAVVDGGIDGVDVLVADLSAAGLEVILIDPDADGFGALANALEGRSDIAALHIYAHGDAGVVMLGTNVIDTASVSGYAGALGDIGGALTETGDILLYGCYVGADADGVALIEELARLTAADVAASDDATGSAELGGDWELEVSYGDIDVEEVAAPSWDGILHSNAVGFKIDVTNGNDTSGYDVAVFFGSWHSNTTFAEGRAVLYSGTGDDPANYTTIAYGDNYNTSGDNEYRFTYVGSTTNAVPSEFGVDFTGSEGSKYTKSIITSVGFTPGTDYFWSDGSELIDTDVGASSTYRHQYAEITGVTPGSYRLDYELPYPTTYDWRPITGVDNVIFTISAGGGLTVAGASNLTVSASEDTAEAITYENFNAVFSATLQDVKITALTSSGTLFLDADGDNQFDNGEQLSVNDTISETDLKADNLFYLGDTDFFGTDSFQWQGTENGTTFSSNASGNIVVSALNDEPVVTTLGTVGGTFTEGTTTSVQAFENADLAAGGSGSYVESDAISKIVLEVSNLEDGSDERLVVLGSEFALLNGETNAAASFTYDITGFASKTATVELTGTWTLAEAEALLNSIHYKNTSNDPTARSGATRVGIKVVSITDSGSDGSGHDAVATVGTEALVAVTPTNDAPTLTATALDPTYVENSAAENIFSNASASTIETGDRVDELVIEVSGILDGNDEKLTLDGEAIDLAPVAITTGTTTNSGYDYTISYFSGTATITVTGISSSTMTVAETAALVNGLKYSIDSDAPTSGTRTVEIKSISDDAGSNDTTTLTGISSDITVTPVEDLPTISISVDNYVTEKTSDVTTGAVVGDPSSPFKLTGISLADADGNSSNNYSVTFSLSGTNYAILDFSSVGVTQTASSVTIINDRTDSVTLTASSLSDINTLLSAGVFYEAQTDKDIISSGINTLTISIDDGQAGTPNIEQTRNITVLPAKPSSTSVNIIKAIEDFEKTDIDDLSHAVTTPGSSTSSIRDNGYFLYSDSATGAIVDQVISSYDSLTTTSVTPTVQLQYFNDTLRETASQQIKIVLITDYDTVGQTITNVSVTLDATPGNSLDEIATAINNEVDYTASVSNGVITVQRASDQTAFLLGVDYGFVESTATPPSENFLSSDGGATQLGTAVTSTSASLELEFVDGHIAESEVGNRIEINLWNGTNSASLTFSVLSSHADGLASIASALDGYAGYSASVSSGVLTVSRSDSADFRLRVVTYGDDGARDWLKVKDQSTVLGDYQYSSSEKFSISTDFDTVDAADIRVLVGDDTDSLRALNASEYTISSGANKELTFNTWSVPSSSQVVKLEAVSASLDAVTTVTAGGATGIALANGDLFLQESEAFVYDAGAGADNATRSLTSTLFPSSYSGGLDVSKVTAYLRGTDGTLTELTWISSGTPTGTEILYDSGTSLTDVTLGTALGAGEELVLRGQAYGDITATTNPSSSAVMYVPDSNFNGAETFYYQYTDAAGVSSSVSQAVVYVEAVNDAPTVSTETPSTTASEKPREEVAFALVGLDNDTATDWISFADVDFASSALEVEVDVNVLHGIIDLGSTSNITIVKGADSSRSMTLRGTIDAIEAALNHASTTYTGDTDLYGEDTLSYKIRDLGNSGTGGAKEASGSLKLDVQNVNDEPSISATALTPTFTELGLPTFLFDNTSIDLKESTDLVKTIKFAVSNLVDGSNEKLIIDGVTVDLSDSNSDAITGGTAGVSISGSTATVTLSFTSGIPVASAETLLDEVRYVNTSNNPTTTIARGVQITELQDTGGVLYSGDDIVDTSSDSSLNASTTLAGINSEPTLTATTGSTLMFTEDTTTSVKPFSSASVDTIESLQNLSVIVLTVENVADGTAEKLVIDGTEITLADGETGKTAGNGGIYDVSLVSTIVTGSATRYKLEVTLSFDDSFAPATGAGATSADGALSTGDFETLVDNIAYKNTSQAPTNEQNRVITITQVRDSGGSANGGDDLNDALSISRQVMVMGVNDAPSFSVQAGDSVSENLSETNSKLTQSGTVTVTDPELVDTVFVTKSLTVSGTGWGQGYVGEPTAAQLNSMFTFNPTVVSNTETSNTLNWAFDSDTTTFDYLAVGETVVMTHAFTAEDPQAGKSTQNVVVTVTGTNDDPTITATSVSGAIVEANTLTQNGSIFFGDLDEADRPIATAATKSVAAVRADGTTPLTLTSAQKTDIENAFSITADGSNTHNGTVNWTYSISESKLDFLGKNEQATAVFTITIDDGNGGRDTQDVTLSVTGANDAPVINATKVSGIILEGATLTDSGSIAFSDLDLTDTPLGTEVTQSVAARLADGKTPLLLSSEQQSAIENAFTIAPVAGNANNGVINWNFNITEQELDFLAYQEVVDLVFTLTINDGNGGSDTQDVTLSVSGANDTPIFGDPYETDLQHPMGKPYIIEAPTSYSDLDGTDRFNYSAFGLPRGLIIDPETGEISGAPLESGPFSIIVRGTDLQGAFVDSNEFSLLVIAPPQPKAAVSAVEVRGDRAPADIFTPEVKATGLMADTVTPASGQFLANPTASGFDANVSSELRASIASDATGPRVLNFSVKGAIGDMVVGSEIEARLADGADLPSWLIFDEDEQTFIATVPEGVSGELETVIIVREADGSERLIPVVIDLDTMSGLSGDEGEQQADEPAPEDEEDGASIDWDDLERQLLQRKAPVEFASNKFGFIQQLQQL